MQYTATAEWRLDSGNRRGVSVGFDLDDLRRFMGTEVVDAMSPADQFKQLQRRAELQALVAVHDAEGLSDEYFAARLKEAAAKYPAYVPPKATT